MIAWLALFVAVVALLVSVYYARQQGSEIAKLQRDMGRVADTLEEPKRREFEVHEAKRRKREEQHRTP